MQVMGGVAGPERGQAKDVARSFRFKSFRDGSHDVGVRGERQMRAMLFKRAEREQHNFVRELEPFDFGPRKIGEVHGLVVWVARNSRSVARISFWRISAAARPNGEFSTSYPPLGHSSAVAMYASRPLV